MKYLQRAAYFRAVTTIHDIKKEDVLLLLLLLKETEAVVCGVNKKKRNHQIKYE